MNILIKRIYEPAAKSDGYRILVDRLWPRGVSKEKAHIDLWFKDIAPSNEIRKEFHSGTDSWKTFSGKYLAELKKNSAVADIVATIKKKDTVTLLFASHDTEHTHAKILLDFLKSKL